MAAGPTNAAYLRSSAPAVEFEVKEPTTKAEKRQSITSSFAKQITRTLSGSINFKVKASSIENTPTAVQNQASRIEKLKNRVLMLKQTVSMESSHINSHITFADNYQKLKLTKSLSQNTEKLSDIKKSAKALNKEFKQDIKVLDAKIDKLNEKTTEADLSALEASVALKEKRLDAFEEVKAPLQTKFTTFVAHCVEKGAVPKEAQKSLNKHPELMTKFFTEVAKRSNDKDLDLKFLHTFGEKALAKGIREAPSDIQGALINQVAKAYAKEGIIPDSLMQDLTSSSRSQMKEAIIPMLTQSVITTGQLPPRPAQGLSLDHQEVFGRIFQGVLASNNKVVEDIGGGGGGVKKVGVQVEGQTKWLYVVKAGSFEFKDQITSKYITKAEAKGFYNNQEHKRELLSNVGFFGARNMAIESVPSNMLVEGKEGNTDVVVMDFAQSEGTLQDLIQHRNLSVDANLMDVIRKREQMQKYEDFNDLKLPRGLNDAEFRQILGEAITDKANVSNKKLMKVVGNTLSQHYEALMEHSGGKVDPEFKAQLESLARDGESENAQEVLNFTAELFTNPQYLEKKNDNFSDALVKMLGEFTYNHDDAIKEKVIAKYEAHPDNQKLEQRAAGLGIDVNKLKLCDQSEFLKKADALSLAKCVYHSVANRGEDSNQGNVVIINENNRVRFSPIDDGETHSASPEMDAVYFFSNVNSLNRALGGKGTSEEEVAYKQSILELDIDKEVTRFTDTYKKHEGKLDEAEHKETIADYAPEMYRGRLDWIKASVANNLFISEIAETQYLNLIHHRVIALQKLDLSPDVLAKQIDRDVANMAKICADNTKLNVDGKIKLIQQSWA